MEQEVAREWAQSFENKDESELAAMELPTELGHCQRQRWNRARDAAIKAAQSARAMPETPTASNNSELAADQKSPVNPVPASAAPDEIAAPPVMPEAPEPQFNSEQMAQNLRERIAAARERVAAPLPALSPGEIKPLALPSGDAAQLLEYQLATSAALIGHLAGYITRDDTMPDVCVSFMDRMSTMIGRSAQVGKVVGQLRGHVSRSHQEISVSHGGGGRGAG